MTIKQRAQRLNGQFPLAYMGVVPVAPTNFTIADRAPTAKDSLNFFIGDMWLQAPTPIPPNPVPVAHNVWMLVNLNQQQATWVHFGAGDVNSLTGNSGGPVLSDANGNINTIADTSSGMNVVGTPGTNTLALFTNSGNAVATNFAANTGLAVPFTATNQINILASVPSGLQTRVSGSGSLLVDTNTGRSVATDYVTNSGTASPVAATDLLNIVGAANTPVTTSGSGSTVTIGLNTLPAFYAFVSANQNNVTGNSVAYLIPFDTLLWQYGGGYDTTTGIYTVPTKGIYTFNTAVTLNGITAAMDVAILQFLTLAGTGPYGNSILAGVRNNPWAVAANSVALQWRYNASTTLQLNAGDTIAITIEIQDGISNSVNVIGHIIDPVTGLDAYWSTFSACCIQQLA